jgi:hypothetical protein
VASFLDQEAIFEKHQEKRHFFEARFARCVPRKIPFCVPRIGQSHEDAVARVYLAMKLASADKHQRGLSVLLQIR